jgi:TM2 domain-containing membrane protein YozV
MQCTTHPDVEAAGICTYSGKPFCKDCLVEIEGKQIGRPYLNQAVAAMKDAAGAKAGPNVYVNSGAGAAPNPPGGPNASVAYVSKGKNRIAAGLLAIFVGGFGIHRFYLGDATGIWYLLFCWTLIPSFIAFIEGIIYLTSDDNSWNAKYNTVAVMR